MISYDDSVFNETVKAELNTESEWGYFPVSHVSTWGNEFIMTWMWILQSDFSDIVSKWYFSSISPACSLASECVYTTVMYCGLLPPLIFLRLYLAIPYRSKKFFNIDHIFFNGIGIT